MPLRLLCTPSQLFRFETARHRSDSPAPVTAPACSFRQNVAPSRSSGYNLEGPERFNRGSRQEAFVMPATPAVRTRLYRDSLGSCAIPSCFTELQPSGKGGQHIAKAAHIVGEKDGSARFDPSVSLGDRNKLENLILMCPTHHDMIDADEETWTVERLRSLKAAHERNMDQLRAVGKAWRQKFIMIDYVNVPRMCGMPGGGVLHLACRDAGLTGDLTFRDLTYEVAQVEAAARNLLAMWDARAVPLDELDLSGTPDVVGTMVSFDNAAYTRNGRRMDDRAPLTGDLKHDPHIWFNASGKRVSIRYNPEWVTTSTAFGNLSQGRGRFAGIGVVAAADRSNVFISALALGLPMRPELEAFYS